MLTIYYCCESRNKAWDQKKEFSILSTKCLVIGATIAFFLALFIFSFVEVTYALLYIGPQVYGHFGSWNSTQCGGEVFITSFWLLNIGSGVVVFIMAVLAVYVSILYFRWVTNPKKQGTLKNLITAFLPKK